MRTLQGYIVKNKSLGNGTTYITQDLRRVKQLYLKGVNQNVYSLKSTAETIMSEYQVSEHNNVWQEAQILEFWA